MSKTFFIVNGRFWVIVGGLKVSRFVSHMYEVFFFFFFLSEDVCSVLCFILIVR